VGELARPVARPAAPEDAGADDIALAMDRRYAAALARSPARVALLWPGADWQAMGLAAAIFAPRARLALALVTRQFDTAPDLAPGIHPLTAIDPSATLGPDVAIGPFCAIGRGARIGAGARIHAHVTIAEGAEIGDGALVLPGVRLGRRVRIGARAILHPNAVIGADGFSFVTPEPGAVEEARAGGGSAVTARTEGFRRIHSLGSVRIGDDVEIGAGTCIDRGTVADTVIGDGTKIDNLVQVGHNVRVGRTCLLCGQVGIAGSAEIGDRVVLGGKVGVADHVRIGADVLVAGGSMVANNLPGRAVYLGAPAIRKDKAAELLILGRRLPELYATVDALQKRVPNPAPTGYSGAGSDGGGDV
jgi:UDP-3-O-[3-hydroxymyristoyl] glucosamine N-acyltransferase